MPIKIRLRRMGRKKQAHYRIVVADNDSPRDGRFVEALGYYKPLSQPARVVVDMERVEYWMGQGAQPSDTVNSILRKVKAGGDASLAVGEVDKEAERKAAQEALAARRRAEAEETEAAAKAEEESARADQAKAAAKAAKAAEAEKADGGEAPEAEGGEEPAAEAEEAPAAEAEEAPAAEGEKAADEAEEKSE